LIEEYNADEDNTAVLAINKFADLTHEEFLSFYVGSPKNFQAKNELNIELFDTSNLPSSVDWSTKGAVTKVKD